MMPLNSLVSFCGRLMMSLESRHVPIGVGTKSHKEKVKTQEERPNRVKTFMCPTPGPEMIGSENHPLSILFPFSHPSSRDEDSLFWKIHFWFQGSATRCCHVTPPLLLVNREKEMQAHDVFLLPTHQKRRYRIPHAAATICMH